MPGGIHELRDFRGSFIPLPLNQAEKMDRQDPRPAITSLYPTSEHFLQKTDQAIHTLIGEGFLLPLDSTYVRERAESYWRFLHQEPYSGLTRGPEKGSLMIIGGGNLDDVFYKTFQKLAGGPKAEIVIIPSANSDEFLKEEGALSRIRSRFAKKGFQKITFLHTRSREEANSEAFVAPIRRARGVWITGGRQWRLADAYLDTQVHQALKQLLERGGVIAGTSAGASIQGSYLARGDTRSNRPVLGDHQKGMAFIRHIAIDQHLLTRNRHFDLLQLRKQHPEILGLGLDENTGIIVRGTVFEVIGKGYVAVYDGKQWAPAFGFNTYVPNTDGQSRFYFLNRGQQYDMQERKVIK
jgi:cyanophycinase